MAVSIPDNCDTVPKLFWQRVEQWSDRTALREKVYGLWREISFQEYGRNAANVACGLIALGLEKGDRVSTQRVDNTGLDFTQGPPAGMRGGR